MQAPHLLLAAGADLLLGRLLPLTAPLPLLLCALAGRLWAQQLAATAPVTSLNDLTRRYPPLACRLPGAESLVLPGVWHFPRWSAAQPWYGSPEVTELWQPYLLEPQAQAHTAAGKSAE